MGDRGWIGLAGALIVVAILLILGLGTGRAVPVAPGGPQAAQEHAWVTAESPHPAYTQSNGYALRQISLPGFAYLYPYLYNYRLQYPVVAFAGQCSGGVLYISNTSALECWDPANNTAWATSAPLTLLYQRTAGIQSQIDNEFQLDTPYDVALLYGNRTTSAGPVTLETVNLTTGKIAIATTPVPMANSIQADYVGGGLVVTWNQSGTNGGPELTNMSNGTSWRSGLAVGVAPNNVYWVGQLHAFINVAGNHLAELRLNPSRTAITNVGNAWVNRSGLSSVTAVNGVQYRATTGQISVMEATNLGAMIGVVKLTGGVLTPAGAYTYLTSVQPYIQRYAYTSPLLWSLAGSQTELFDPLTNATQSAPNLVSRANSSGGNQNYEFTDPYTTAVYLSLNTALVGNATRAPNSFVWATAPAAVHSRAFLVSNTVAWPTGNYQQAAIVNSAIDEPWESGNLSNVFWTYASNGTSIPAWLQNGSTNVSAATIWELSLASIPGHGSVSIYEDFASMATVTFSRTGNTGEAPGLTGTYGAFDNGAVVFPMYDNFAGATLNTHIWTASFASGSAVVSNGITTTSVQTGHGSRPACGLVANYNNLTGSFAQSAQISAGGMGYSKQVGLFTTLTPGAANCATNYQVVSQIDLSRTDYQPSNIYGIFSQSAAGNNYNVNTVGLTYKISAPYLMGLDQANDSAHNYANTSVNGTPANSAGQRFGNLKPAGRLYGGIALWSGNGLAVGNITWWRETAEVATMPTLTGVPLAPTGVTATSPTSVKITLNWTLPPGAVSNVTAWPWAGPTCSGITLGTASAGDASTVSFTGLTANTSYSYRLAAFNSTGMGVLTSCLAASTIGVPFAPGSLTTGTPGSFSIPLSWRNAPGYTSNETVYVGTSCGSWISATSTNGTATAYAVIHLKPTTTYSFAVSSWNATGQSPLSGCVSATTATPGPAPPGPQPTPGPSPLPFTIPAAPSGLGTWLFVLVLILVAAFVLSRIGGDDETRL